MCALVCPGVAWFGSRVVARNGWGRWQQTRPNQRLTENDQAINPSVYNTIIGFRTLSYGPRFQKKEKTTMAAVRMSHARSKVWFGESFLSGRDFHRFCTRFFNASKPRCPVEL